MLKTRQAIGDTQSPQQACHLRSNFPGGSLDSASLPREWKFESKLSKTLRLMENGRGIQCVNFNQESGVGALTTILADKPVPSEGSFMTYFYEVKIRRKEAEGLIAIGFKSLHREIM